MDQPVLLDEPRIEVDSAVQFSLELGPLTELTALPFELISSLMLKYFHPEEPEAAVPWFTPTAGFSLGSSMGTPVTVTGIQCNKCTQNFSSYSSLYSHQASCSGPVVLPRPKQPTPTAQPWACGACTIENSPDVDICSMCQSVRNTEDYWSCTQCTLTNPMSADVCEVCQAQKTITPAPSTIPAFSSSPTTPPQATTVAAAPSSPSLSAEAQSAKDSLVRIKTFLLATDFHQRLLAAVLDASTLPEIRVCCLTLLAAASEHGNASNFFDMMNDCRALQLVARNAQSARIAKEMRDFLENVIFAWKSTEEAVTGLSSFLAALLEQWEASFDQLLSSMEFNELLELVQFVLLQLEEQEPERLYQLSTTKLLPLLSRLAARIGQLKSAAAESEQQLVVAEKVLRAFGIFENLGDHTYFHQPLSSSLAPTFNDWHEGANLLELADQPSLVATVLSTSNINVDTQLSSSALLRFIALANPSRTSATIRLDLQQLCRVTSIVLLLGPRVQSEVEVDWSLSTKITASSARPVVNIRDNHPRVVQCSKLGRYMRLTLNNLGAAPLTLQVAVFGYVAPFQASTRQITSGEATAGARETFELTRLRLDSLVASLAKCRSDLLGAVNNVSASASNASVPAVLASRVRAYRRAKLALTVTVRRYREAHTLLTTLHSLHGVALPDVHADHDHQAHWCNVDRLQFIFQRICSALPELDSQRLFGADAADSDPEACTLDELFVDIARWHPAAIVPLGTLLQSLMTTKRWPSFPRELIKRCFSTSVEATLEDAFRSIFQNLAEAHSSPSDIFCHQLITDLVQFLDSDDCTNMHVCSATLTCMAALVDDHAVLLKPSVHQGSHCGNCQMMPIVGVRYHCAQCLDFSLCQDCFTRFVKELSPAVDHSVDHSFLLVPQPLPLPPPQNLSVAAIKILSQPLLSKSLYGPRLSSSSSSAASSAVAAAAAASETGSACSSCQESLVGVHYKCASCPDYSLCSRCQAATDDKPHFPLHVMLVLTRPPHLPLARQAESSPATRDTQLSSTSEPPAFVKPLPQTLISSQSTIPLLLHQKLYPQLVRQALRLKHIQHQASKTVTTAQRSGRASLTRSLDSAPNASSTLRSKLQVPRGRAGLVKSTGGVSSGRTGGIFSKSDGHPPLPLDRNLTSTGIEGHPLSVVLSSIAKLLDSSSAEPAVLRNGAVLLAKLSRLYSADEITSHVVLHPSALPLLNAVAVHSDLALQQEVLWMFAEIVVRDGALVQSETSVPAFKLLVLVLDSAKEQKTKRARLLFFAQLSKICVKAVVSVRNSSLNTELHDLAFTLLEFFDRLPLTSTSDLGTACLIFDTLALLHTLPSGFAFVSIFCQALSRLAQAPAKYQPLIPRSVGALTEHLLRIEPNAFIAHAFDLVSHSSPAQVGRVSTKVVASLAQYFDSLLTRKNECSRLELPPGAFVKLIAFVAATLPPVASLSVVDLDRYWCTDSDLCVSSTGYQLLPAVCDMLSTLLSSHRRATALHSELAAFQIASEEFASPLECLFHWHSAVCNVRDFAANSLPVASSVAALLAACLSSSAAALRNGAVQAAARVFVACPSQGLHQLLVTQFERAADTAASFFLANGVADTLLRRCFGGVVDGDGDFNGSDGDDEHSLHRHSHDDDNNLQFVDLNAEVTAPAAFANVMQRRNAAAPTTIARGASYELVFGRSVVVHEIELLFEIKKVSEGAFSVLSSLPTAVSVFVGDHGRSNALPTGSTAFAAHRVDSMPRTIAVRVKLESPRSGNCLQLVFEQQPASVVLVSHLRFWQVAPASKQSMHLGLLPLLASCLHTSASCQRLVGDIGSKAPLRTAMLRLLELEDPAVFVHVHSVFVSLCTVERLLLLSAVPSLLDSASQRHHTRLLSALCSIANNNNNNDDDNNDDDNAKISQESFRQLSTFVAQLLSNGNRTETQGELVAGFAECLTTLLHESNGRFHLPPAIFSQAVLVCRSKSIGVSLRDSLLALLSAALQQDVTLGDELLLQTENSLQQNDLDDDLQLEIFGTLASASPAMGTRILQSGVLQQVRRLVSSGQSSTGEPPRPPAIVYKLLASLAHSFALKDWLVANVFDSLFDRLPSLDGPSIVHVEALFVNVVNATQTISASIFDRLLSIILGQALSQDNPFVRLFLKVMAVKDTVPLSFRRSAHGRPLEPISSLVWRATASTRKSTDGRTISAAAATSDALTTVTTTDGFSSGVHRWRVHLRTTPATRLLQLGFVSEGHPESVAVGGSFGTSVALRLSRGVDRATVCCNDQHYDAPVDMQLRGFDTLEFTLDLDAGSLSVRHGGTAVSHELFRFATYNTNTTNTTTNNNNSNVSYYPAVTFSNANDEATIELLSSYSAGARSRLQPPLLYHVSPNDVSFAAQLDSRIRDFFPKLHFAELALADGLDPDQTIGELLRSSFEHPGHLVIRYCPASSVLQKNPSLRLSVGPTALESPDKVIFSAFSTRLDVLVKALEQRHSIVTQPGALWPCYAQWFALINAALSLDGFSSVFAADQRCQDRLFSLFQQSNYHELPPAADQLTSEAQVLQPLLSRILAFAKKANANANVNVNVNGAASTTASEEPTRTDSALLRALMNCLSYLTRTSHRNPPRFLSAEELARIQQRAAEAAESAAASRQQGDVVWASGVGYGHGDKSAKSKWNSKATAKALKTRNQLVLSLLSLIVESAGGQDDSLALLTDSCLVPVLLDSLRNDSLFDMMKAADYTRKVFQVVQSIAANPRLHPLFDINDGATIPALLLAMETNAKKAIETIQLVKGAAEASSSEESKDADEELSFAQLIVDTSTTVRTAILPPPQSSCEVASQASSSSEAASSSSSAASSSSSSSEAASSSSSSSSEAASSSGAASSSSSSSSSATAASSSTTTTNEQEYRGALQDLQFGSAEILQQTHKFHYQTSLANVGKMTQRKMRRIIRELSSLQTGLPLSPACSIFVRVDSNRTDCMQALITAPMGTPYGGGCFVFDIFLDQDYPSKSPKVNLETTGNGSVRFNPNLYNCGKVCLSLLGTWQGASNESWDPDQSTLLQVLVSIQSLILVDEPYFNEPGYESRYDDASSKAKSSRYNSCIRVASVRWAMVNQIVNPAEDFAPVIHRHFALMKQPIIEQIASWVELSHSSELEPLLEAAASFVKAVEAIPPIEGLVVKPLVVPEVIQNAIDKLDWTTRVVTQFTSEINTDIYSF